MALYAITDIIQWAKISQYLGEWYGSRNRLLKGRNLDPYYTNLIFMESEILEFMNSFDPSDSNIDAYANYVYGLTKYLAEAKVIAGGTGGGTVIPGTGTAATIVDISLDFELGFTSSPQIVNGVSVDLPNDGDSSFILPLENIMSGSLLLTIGGVPQPRKETDNSTYTIINYTTSQATITLNPSGFTFQTGNTYIISGLQYVSS